MFQKFGIFPYLAQIVPYLAQIVPYLAQIVPYLAQIQSASKHVKIGLQSNFFQKILFYI